MVVMYVWLCQFLIKFTGRNHKSCEKPPPMVVDSMIKTNSLLFFV
jgi:hypothetical protein